MLVPVVVETRNDVYATEDVTMVRIHTSGINDKAIMILITYGFVRAICINKGSESVIEDEEVPTQDLKTLIVNRNLDGIVVASHGKSQTHAFIDQR